MADRIKEIKVEMIKVLEQFGDRSNIPMNHPYWKLGLELQQLVHNQQVKEFVDYEPIKD